MLWYYKYYYDIGIVFAYSFISPNLIYAVGIAHEELYYFKLMKITNGKEYIDIYIYIYILIIIIIYLHNYIIFIYVDI